MIDERVALNLDNMKRATSQAITFLAGKTEAEFLEDPLLQNACAMCLLIIGESTGRIERKSPEFVAERPDWPWNGIRGLRNKIAHDYFNLDLSVIWLTVRQSLPDLLEKIEALGPLDP